MVFAGNILLTKIKFARNLLYQQNQPMVEFIADNVDVWKSAYDVKGISCHGSAPERGDNAIYKMADILQDVRALNENDDDDGTEIKGLVKMLNPKYNPDWEEARFLGRGTVTTSQIFYTSPSRCAVADFLFRISGSSDDIR